MRKDVDCSQATSQDDRFVVGHIKNASPQPYLLRLGRNVDQGVERVEHMPVDFRKMPIWRAGIGRLRLYWIEQAFDCPERAVSESFRALRDFRDSLRRADGSDVRQRETNLHANPPKPGWRVFNHIPSLSGRAHGSNE